MSGPARAYSGDFPPAMGRDAHDHVLSPLPRDDSEIEHFATSYNLAHKLETLQKGAYLLSHDPDDDISELTAQEQATARLETSRKWRQPRMLYFTIMACSLGAVEQGWAQTSMNGANLYFPAALNVGTHSAKDVFIVGFINSALYFSIGLWGSWLSEPLNRRFGRRGAIFAGSLLCLIGNLGCAISWNWKFLAWLRLVLGTGLGINASTVSVFAAECAPATIRGGLAVSWQMWTAFGIFLGFLTNVAVYDFGPNTWRFQLAAPFLPAAALLFVIYTCPESPAWHIKRGRYDLAYREMCKLRNAEVLAARDVYASYLHRDTPTESSYFSRLCELFTIPRIRTATVAAGICMLAQQLCGINIIAFYSSTLFHDAGFTTYGALLASCVFGLVNFLGAFPAVWTMDSLGRRTLLLWTLPLMAVTMLAAGLVFELPQGTFQFGALAALIYLFCAIYSPGMGPVPVAYSAEVFPLSHREIGMSLAVASASFWAAILSLTAPGLLAGIGTERTFELYAVLNVLAFALVFLFVRETKERTLDGLDAVFAGDLGSFAKYQVEELRAWWRPRSRTKRAHMEYSELEQNEDRGFE